LPLPALPLVMQLINSDTSACFATPDVTKNTSAQFKAKTP